MLRCSATMAATLRKSPLPFNAFDSTIPFSPKAISSLRRTASCLGEKRFSARGSHLAPSEASPIPLVVLGSGEWVSASRSFERFPMVVVLGGREMGAPAVVVEEEEEEEEEEVVVVKMGKMGVIDQCSHVLIVEPTVLDNGNAQYLMALDKYPVTTKAITSAILTLVGDLICQLLIDQVSKLDLKRTFVFTLLGLVLVGPTLHIWYLYLSKLVICESEASGAFVRLLLDQFIFSPIFIGVFMSLLVTLEGRPSLVVPKLQQEWFSSVLANWQLWIPFQFLNFYFVPQKFQVLAANFVALAWNVILSFKAHKEVVLK
ncbi:Protein Mpv17 [Ananas comosus]|uniref:Protein Mpv17 n=1 Tax=Ananas comosus TaxID=4615 RepID=A0A199W167_ANACO|nr:Protein Mpv17 [Ananas comosus]